MKNLLDTKTASLQEVLGNGKIYEIPRFQRDYSWTEENWEDLWNDFVLTEESNTPHYMGTIVLQTTEKDDLFVVVDGQQRLTTMTIFAVATMKVLQDLQEKGIESKDNEQRIEEIQRTFLGKKTISGLHYESKLKLNKNNDLFFQDRILILKEPIAYNKLKDSEKLLFDTYKYFYEKLSEKFKNDTGKKIGYFLESVIAKKMIFIQITVDNDLSAYTVFETLNARGVELTTTDLLKNYLFSVSAKITPESQMGILEERWNRIVHTIGLKGFPIFLRYYLNSKQKLVRKEQLFKTIKNSITNSDEVFELLDVLEEKAFLYNAIKDPDDEFWNEIPHKKEIKRSLEELKLFGVSQPIPLLFSVYEKNPDIFHNVLQILVNVSFRYNIIAKRNPNDLEVIYNSIAQKVFSKSIKTKQEIIFDMKKIYVEDIDFKQFFSTKEITTGGKNKKLVKYILTKIENQISVTDNQWEDSNFTIEHILPENFDQEWNLLFDGNAQKFIYRLGNYTLLEEKKNRDCSNKNYQEKREIYKKSKYKLTNEICMKDEWNIKTLNSFQTKLSDFASTVWKVQF
jgi:uncharacterized protein with ParB-like and HNH nuclease domain